MPVLEYISGYILKKFYIECEPGDSRWIRNVSKGSLRIPSDSFKEAISQLEVIFKLSNGCNNIYRGKDFVNYHVNLCNHIDLSVPIKQLFFRVRLFARIRLLNELRKTARIEQTLRRRMAKKAKQRVKRLREKATELRHPRSYRKTKTFKKMKKTKSYSTIVLFVLSSLVRIGTTIISFS